MTVKKKSNSNLDPWFAWLSDAETGEIIATIDFTDSDFIQTKNVTISWCDDGTFTLRREHERKKD